ncbi:YgjV family protein [uncultured Roseobacter sp.]|uniref:YgjV family protein n=1 Tax=uncultured Roseobacter sp. TaxID=114847 RepID=UPI002610FF89|nr:YgjV family protein [uncultured Roseobacter sp.]
MTAQLLLSQILAAGAFGLGIWAINTVPRGLMLRRWCYSAALNAVHLLLLAEPIGAGAALITAARFLMASLLTKYSMWSVIGPAAFIVLGLLYASLTQTMESSILAQMAFVTGTVGSFFQSILIVRGFMIITTTLWLSYNLLIPSPVAILSESCFLIYHLIKLRQIYRERTNEFNQS